MSAEKIYQQKFLPVAKYLLKELEYYGENQFKRKTTASAWTIGQLYDHLIQGTYDNHIRAIKDCLANRNGAAMGGKTIKGGILFGMGGYLPVKIKGQPDYVPAQIETPEKARDMMYAFLKEMNKLAVEIDKKNDHAYKIKHPKLGRLTAREWYELITMHQKHHLRQKKRIDKILRTFVKEENHTTAGSVQ